ncbi:homeobox-leucine zipper protein HAT7-like [Humulus lupulus]|uniref:homeobox-leucine zipper protein HAT7-like n=1 Tax=Humulus lupulus TaxID=3486 RepID=UPI002B416905|nr:homeobox-leucine zipper protein HAT7-like [Humulus lupulus]
MDQIQNQKGSSSSSTKVVAQNMNKKRLNEHQVRVLERNFNYEKKLEQEHKHQLADQLGIPARQVAVWYQNKRARWRTQSLEVDCTTLQHRLDTALAEKRRLEGEVLVLRGELDMACQALQLTDNNNTIYYDNTTYYDNINNNIDSSYCTATTTTSTTATTDQEQGQEGDGRSYSSFSDNPQYDHHHVINNYDHLLDHIDDDQFLQIDHDFFSSLIDW